jgi:hypothetical protein
MSVGKVLMIMLSILVFGLLCFVAGFEFKARNTGIALFQIMIGLMSLNWTFNTLIETGPEKKSGK